MGFAMRGGPELSGGAGSLSQLHPISA